MRAARRLDDDRGTCMTLRWLLLVVLGVALVAVPGAYDSPVGGPALGPSGRLAVCALFALAALVGFFPPRRAPGWWLHGALAAGVAAKLVIGISAVPSGWKAEYRYGDRKGETHTARFFWRFASHAFRIDQRIAFDQTNFDLHFFNHSPLFGFRPYSTTRRELEFPLQVTWWGHLGVDAPRELRLTGSADGRLRAELRAGDRLVATFDGTDPTRVAVSPADGPLTVRVTFEKPAGVDPRVEFAVVDEATGAPVAVTAWPTDREATRAWPTTGIVFAGLGVLLAGLVLTYARAGSSASTGRIARASGLLATLVVVAWTGGLATKSMGQTAFLHGGGDPLTYASDARQILHDSPLLLDGRPLGRAAPFYFYPLYPYALASTYAFVGEDLSAIYLLNGLALAALPLLLLHLGWAHLRWWAAIVANLALVVFIGRYCWPIAAYGTPSFPDILFLPVVFAALVLLRRAYEHPRPAALVAAGVLMGLGAATRPSLLMLVGLAPLGLLVAMSPTRPRSWVTASLWLAAGVFAGLLPFTLRNLVASGQFVVLVNSWIQLPYFLIPPEVVDRPTGTPTLFEAVRMARDIVVADPWGSLWVEVRKIVFTLGYTAIGPQGAAVSNSLTVLTPLFALAVWLKRVPRAAGIVLITFAISHLLAMVLAAPWTFGLKTILPLHLAFLFAAAWLLNGRANPAFAWWRSSNLAVEARPR